MVFKNKTYLYESRTGALKLPNHLTELKLVQWNMTALAPLHPTIYHSIILYNFTEIQTHASLNDLMGTVSAQRQLLQN